MIDTTRFRELAASTGSPSTSIYIPTHTMGPEVKQDAIRLKNRLTRVDSDLEHLGWSPKDRSRHLDAARSLVDSQDFWRHQGRSLAVFIDPKGEMSTHALPDETAEVSVVADAFHVRPLLSALQVVEVPVLVLTEGAVRLVVSRGQGVSPVDADLPESMSDVNWFVDREKSNQEHPTGPAHGQMHHGHDPQERVREDCDRFLRAVDEALPPWTRDGALIVLGVDDLVHRFERMSEREVLSPPNGGIGQVDDLAAIATRVQPLVEQLSEERERAFVEDVRSAYDAGEAVVNLDGALQAAVAGRLERVAIAAGAEPRWGRFDAETLETTRHGEQSVGSVDLLDRLVVHAVGTGAETRLVGEPIAGHDLMAVLRF